MLSDAASVIVEELSEKTCGSVRLPSELVVPHSNHPAEETPPGTRFPFSAAEFAVIAVASFVVAEAVLVWEYPAKTPNDKTYIKTPKDRLNLIVPPMWSSRPTWREEMAD